MRALPVAVEQPRLRQPGTGDLETITEDAALGLERERLCVEVEQHRPGERLAVRVVEPEAEARGVSVRLQRGMQHGADAFRRHGAGLVLHGESGHAGIERDRAPCRRAARGRDLQRQLAVRFEIRRQRDAGRQQRAQCLEVEVRSAGLQLPLRRLHPQVDAGRASGEAQLGELQRRAAAPAVGIGHEPAGKRADGRRGCARLARMAAEVRLAHDQLAAADHQPGEHRFGRQAQPRHARVEAAAAGGLEVQICRGAAQLASVRQHDLRDLERQALDRRRRRRGEQHCARHGADVDPQRCHTPVICL